MIKGGLVHLSWKSVMKQLFFPQRGFFDIYIRIGGEGARLRSAMRICFFHSVLNTLDKIFLQIKLSHFFPFLSINRQYE